MRSTKGRAKGEEHKAKPAKASKKTQKLVELDEADYESEFENYNEDEPEEAEEYVSDFLPKASQIIASAKSAWQEESSQQNTTQITQDTIAMLFEQKESNEHKAVINTAVTPNGEKNFVSEVYGTDAARQVIEDFKEEWREVMTIYKFVTKEDENE